MKVTFFTKQNLPEVRKQINAKLAELQALGLDIKLGNIKFTSDTFTSKIECRLEGAKDVFADAFDKSALSINYRNAIGKQVTIGSKVYTFKGFRPNARVKQAIIEIGGKQYRVDFNVISSQLV